MYLVYAVPNSIEDATSTAEQVLSLLGLPDEDGEVAGFWLGIWHGLISPITFVVSLFNRSVYVFEVHNNGGWYTFGFLLGASMTFGGSGGGAARRRKKRD